MAGEKVSKDDIKKVLAKAKEVAGAKIDKPKDRIIDNSIPGKEKPPEKPKDKLDLILEKVGKIDAIEKRIDTLEQTNNRSVSGKETKGEGSETTGKTNQQLLDEAEREQEQETGQPQGQITQEEYQKLSAEEKVKLWEQQAKRASQGPTAEQALAQGERRQQPQSGATKAGINPQYIYLLTKTIENLGPIVQTAIAKGGGGGEKSGESLESLGKELVVGLLKKSIDGQIGGAVSDGTQQLQAFSNMQNLMLGGFFNTLKLLGKEPAQKMVTDIFANPNLPGSQISPSSPEQRISP